ncbi:UNVERIFIED_CONTAM: hypothetical protein K2H54_048577 [Gekko kuhli]
MARNGAQLRLLVSSLMLVLVFGQEEGQAGASFGENCLARFTAGMPEFVLDMETSVQSGATFLASPPLEGNRDCVRACCKNPECNLALVEQAPGEEDSIQSCILMNCLYDHDFVCKFAKKDGFLNYIERDMYEAYVSMLGQGNGVSKHPGYLLLNYCNPIAESPSGLICSRVEGMSCY